MRRILAFDLGSHMGVAWFADPSGWVHSEHWELPGSRPERFAALVERLTEFEEGCYGLNTVVYERPFARGQYATRSLWGTAGIIEAWAQRRGAAVVDVTPAEIKKFATGSGKAEKEAMIAAAQTFGYSGTNEHEADAVCLLMYAHANITTEN